jgi:hypothetical protein
MGERGTRICPMVCAALLTTVCGIAGCGGDSEKSNGGSATASQASSDASDITRAERKRITAVMPKLSTAIVERNARAFCAQMTPAGRQEVVGVAKSATGKRHSGCRASFRAYMAHIPKAKQARVDTKSVTVDGSTAKVTIRGGLAGASTVTYTLTRADRTWKVKNPFSANPTIRPRLR